MIADLPALNIFQLYFQSILAAPHLNIDNIIQLQYWMLLGLFIPELSENFI